MSKSIFALSNEVEVLTSSTAEASREVLSFLQKARKPKYQDGDVIPWGNGKRVLRSGKWVKYTGDSSDKGAALRATGSKHKTPKRRSDGSYGYEKKEKKEQPEGADLSGLHRGQQADYRRAVQLIDHYMGMNEKRGLFTTPISNENLKHVRTLLDEQPWRGREVVKLLELGWEEKEGIERKLKEGSKEKAIQRVNTALEEVSKDSETKKKVLGVVSKVLLGASTLVIPGAIAAHAEREKAGREEQSVEGVLKEAIETQTQMGLGIGRLAGSIYGAVKAGGFASAAATAMGVTGGGALLVTGMGIYAGLKLGGALGRLAGGITGMATAQAGASAARRSVDLDQRASKSLSKALSESDLNKIIDDSLFSFSQEDFDVLGRFISDGKLDKEGLYKYFEDQTRRDVTEHFKKEEANVRKSIFDLSNEIEVLTGSTAELVSYVEGLSKSIKPPGGGWEKVKGGSNGFRKRKRSGKGYTYWYPSPTSGKTRGGHDLENKGDEVYRYNRGDHFDAAMHHKQMSANQDHAIEDLQHKVEEAKKERSAYKTALSRADLLMEKYGAKNYNELYEMARERTDEIDEEWGGKKFSKRAESIRRNILPAIPDYAGPQLHTMQRDIDDLDGKLKKYESELEQVKQEKEYHDDHRQWHTGQFHGRGTDPDTKKQREKLWDEEMQKRDPKTVPPSPRVQEMHQEMRESERIAGKWGSKKDADRAAELKENMAKEHAKDVSRSHQYGNKPKRSLRGLFRRKSIIALSNEVEVLTSSTAEASREVLSFLQKSSRQRGVRDDDFPLPQASNAL